MILVKTGRQECRFSFYGKADKELFMLILSWDIQ